MLPFIAGLAVGAGAVVAYNNNKEIREGIQSGANKAKEYAEAGYEKTKEIACDVKETVSSKIDSLKSSKEECADKCEDKQKEVTDGK